MTVHGIDVSKWQGRIDWVQVRNAGYTWVATRTWDRQTDAVDETFAYNRDEMAFGRWRLLYYWLEPGRVSEGVAEFFDSIGELRPGEGAMLDAEEEGITLAECIEWCELVEARTGYPCAVYTGGYTCDGALWHSDELFNGKRARIFAAYTSEADARGHADGIAWDAWQYSCTGTVPGVDADCDLDRIDNPAAFDRCLRPATTAPPADEAAVLAALAALQVDIDGLVTNSANRYKDLEAKINRNRDHVDGLATNESNRYAQYVGWHDDVMGAL